MKCEMKKMMILRRRAVVLLLCVAVAAAAFAEEDKNAAGNGEVTYFQFSLFPGLGVNGWRTWEYTNWASVNLLGDVSMNERAFTLSGIWSAVKGDAQGVQIAGLVNYAGQGRGLMLSGLVNALKGEYDGLTVSGLANVAGGRVRGVQVSGGMNLSGSLRGVQLTGIAAIAKGDVKGVQLAGVMDYADGDMDGVQLAGLTGIAVGDVEGAQISGAVNFSLEMSGVQMAAFANVVRGDVEGVQISAVANCAREVEGVQIGLVNVAEESDVPIGLINVIEDGEMSIGAGYDMIGNTMLTFRSGGEYTYGIIGAGYNHYFRHVPVAVEAGLGVHAPVCDWFRVDNEFRYTSPLLIVTGDGTDAVLASRYMNVSYSLLPFFRVCRHFGVYAGMTLNYMLSDSRLELPELVRGGTVWQNMTDGGVFGKTRGTLFFGFSAGIQVLF